MKTELTGSPGRSPIRPLLAWIAALFVVSLGVAAWEVLGPGLLLLTVHNDTEGTLSSVTVSSPHRRVSLGELRPRASRFIAVPGLDEGGLRIFVRDAAGGIDSIDAPIYLQPESKGYLHVDLRDPGTSSIWRRWMAPFWDM
jgi:hypothetical protein